MTIGEYTLIFNGEIYNYLELKEKLKKKNFKLLAVCDIDGKKLKLIKNTKKQNRLKKKPYFPILIWFEKNDISSKNQQTQHISSNGP